MYDLFTLFFILFSNIHDLLMLVIGPSCKVCDAWPWK